MPTDIVLVGAIDVLDSFRALQAMASSPFFLGSERAV